MNDFLEINKPKLKFAFFALLTIFSFIGLLAAFLIEGLTQMERLLLIVSIGFGFTIIILSLAIASEYARFSTRRKAFNSPGISDFFNLNNFQTVLTGKESKWSLSKESKKGIVNGFTVVANLHTTDSNLLHFDFLVKHTPLTNERFKHLEKLFRHHEAEFNIESISLNVNYKKQYSQIDLKNRLSEFSQLLVKEDLFSTMKPSQL